MRTEVRTLLALATAGAFFPTEALAQDPRFAPPVRLQAGDKLLGEGRLYPSPVYHDMNGDGLLDIVVGDLIGKLTVALRQPGDGRPTFAGETKLMALDGKEIDFRNW